MDALTQPITDFSENRFELIKGDGAANYNGNIDEYGAEENLFSVRIEDGVVTDFFEGNYYDDRTLSTNVFEAQQNIFVGYAMVTLPFGEKLKFTGGARYEGTGQQISLEDSTLFNPTLQEDPEAIPGVLQLNDVLPSANLIYSITEDMNLRAGYSRTLARPSIAELSSFIRKPYIGGPDVIGNLLLERTLTETPSFGQCLLYLF